MKQKLKREFEVLEAECNCLHWNLTRALGLTPPLQRKCYRNFNIYNVQDSGFVPCLRTGFKKKKLMLLRILTRRRNCGQATDLVKVKYNYSISVT